MGGLARCPPRPCPCWGESCRTCIEWPPSAVRFSVQGTWLGPSEMSCRGSENLLKMNTDFCGFGLHSCKPIIPEKVKRQEVFTWWWERMGKGSLPEEARWCQADSTRGEGGALLPPLPHQPQLVAFPHYITVLLKTRQGSLQKTSY